MNKSHPFNTKPQMENQMQYENDFSKATKGKMIPNRHSNIGKSIVPTQQTQNINPMGGQ